MLRMCAGGRCPIVVLYFPQPYESVVNIRGVRSFGLFVSADGVYQVAFEGSVSHGHPVQTNVPEPVDNAIETRPARPHHKHPFVAGDEWAAHVDDGLCAAGAGQSFHDKGCPGLRLRNNLFLLLVGVEQEGVRLWRTDILRRKLERRESACLNGGARGGTTR